MSDDAYSDWDHDQAARASERQRIAEMAEREAENVEVVRAADIQANRLYHSGAAVALRAFAAKVRKGEL